MDKVIAEELESKHAALHALIEEEEHRAHPDEDLLHRLKKEKVRLKDELAGHLTHWRGLFRVRRSPIVAPPAPRQKAPNCPYRALWLQRRIGQLRLTLRVWLER